MSTDLWRQDLKDAAAAAGWGLLFAPIQHLCGDWSTATGQHGPVAIIDDQLTHTAAVVALAAAVDSAPALGRKAA